MIRYVIKGFGFLLGMLFCLNPVFAQDRTQENDRPVIDTSTFGQWPRLHMAKVTNDGNYVYFEIQEGGTMVSRLKAVHGDWEVSLTNIGGVEFTKDSKSALITENGDSLYLLQLGRSARKFVGLNLGGESIIHTKRADWIAFRPADTEPAAHTLFLRNLANAKEIRLGGVMNYKLNSNSETIVYCKSETQGNTLHWLDFGSGADLQLYSAHEIDISGLIFDRNGEHFIFPGKSGKHGRSLIYCTKGSSQVIEIKPDSLTSKVDKGLKVDLFRDVRFNGGGTKIFISLSKNRSGHAPKTYPGYVPYRVSIWSYSDTILRTEDDWATEGQKIIAVLDIAARTLVQLSGGSETLADPDGHGKDRLKYALFFEGNPWDQWWNKYRKLTVSLVGLADGSKQIVAQDAIHDYFWLSPGEKFVLSFDPAQGNYFTYEIATGTKREISSKIGRNLVNTFSHNQGPLADGFGVGGWLENDEALFVYDRFDIWQIDPLGVKAPIDLTGGYGAANKIELRFKEDQYPGYPGSSKHILNAYNTTTKENGFVQIRLDRPGQPILLTMGHYKYQLLNAGPVYLVNRESATEAPNLFVSPDLKNFTRVTEGQPQKKYNWMTAELIHWKGLDGMPLDGILYKPQNFDPSKKYPVIFNYYEERTRELNEFRFPDVARDFINVPWFVSRGYLVCLPDISFDVKGRSNGESAVNSVVAAGNYLAGMPWVDATRMALQGHSFSGGTTNYIIGHSHLFAAAVESAGVSDPITSYLSTGYGGADRMDFEFNSQGRALGGTIWEVGSDFLNRASSLLKANEVTTPLLMVHNKPDGAVPWSEGFQMFLALRRLGKRVWWLQYDNEAHIIAGAEDAMDYTIRMTQFFDHYLKGAPLPRWMTDGVPQRLRLYETGYDLDPSAKEPEDREVLYGGKLQKVSEAMKN